MIPELTSDRMATEPDGLFARARAGDQDAWEQLFRTCYPKVVRVVRRKLNPPMRSLYDSTDFASDVLKSLAAKCEQFDFPSIDSLMKFLKQAAEQKVIDEYRRRHTRKRDINLEQRIEAGPNGSGAADLRSTDPSPSTIAQVDEQWERIRSPLDDEGRAILDLKREGHTNEEVARLTGLSIRKVQRFIQVVKEKWPEAGGGR